MSQTLMLQFYQGYTKMMLKLLNFNVLTRNGNDTQGIDDNYTYKDYLGQRPEVVFLVQSAISHKKHLKQN